MKTILAAVNAKYIHSNLAVYSLRAYTKDYLSETKIAEYTINQQIDEILMDLYREQPELLQFSHSLESGLCGGAGAGDQKDPAGDDHLAWRFGSLLRCERGASQTAGGYRSDERGGRGDVCRASGLLSRENRKAG